MKILASGSLLQNGKYRIVKFDYDDGLCANVYSAMMAVEVKGRLGTVKSKTPVLLYEMNVVSKDEDAFRLSHKDYALDSFRENGTCYYVRSAATPPLDDHHSEEAKIAEEVGFGSYLMLDGSQPYNTWKRIPVTDPLPFPDKEIVISWINRVSNTESEYTDTKTIKISMDGQSYSSAYHRSSDSFSHPREEKLLFECQWWMHSMDGVYSALKKNGFLSKQHWEIEVQTTILEGIELSFDFIYKSRQTFRRLVDPANLGWHELLLIAVREFVAESSIWMYLPPGFLDKYLFYKRPQFS